jgi:hypothetical protein
MALGVIGGKADAEAVGRLQSDSAKLGIKGFAGGTVGTEARAVLEKLRKKG